MNVAELLAATEVGAPLTTNLVLLEFMLEMVSSAFPVLKMVNVRESEPLTATFPKSVWSVVEGVMSPSLMVTNGEPPCTSISGTGTGAGPKVKLSYPVPGQLNLSNLTDFAVPQKLTDSTLPGEPFAVTNSVPVPSTPSKTRIRNPTQRSAYALKLVVKPAWKLTVGFAAFARALPEASPGLKVIP